MHLPMYVANIEFVQPKRKNVIKNYVPPSKLKKIPYPTYAERKAFISTLEAAILNTRAPKVGPRMNYSVARVFPPTIVSFINPENYRKLKKEELLLECTQLLNEMVLTEYNVEYLAEVTKLQADSLLWFQHWKGRLTASQ